MPHCHDIHGHLAADAVTKESQAAIGRHLILNEPELVSGLAREAEDVFIV